MNKESRIKNENQINPISVLPEKLQSPDTGDNSIKEEFSESSSLSEIIIDMVDRELEQVVTFHTAGDHIKDWNIKEISEVSATIFPVAKDFSGVLEDLINEDDKYNDAKARTLVLDHLLDMAQQRYAGLKQSATKAGIPFEQVEKQILLRSFDSMWIDHLEAIDYLRRGIGLRGYGQRDPLVEYKKEAYQMYNELNNLIQRQVVYTIYKIGDVGSFSAPGLADRAVMFSAPAKTMDDVSSSFSGFGSGDGESGKKAGQLIKPAVKKARDDEGHKIGRNDLCPCGSGKKYKKCHGR
jgi:preprotein translocase subunit SecA